jgi:hypothetical protein
MLSIIVIAVEVALFAGSQALAIRDLDGRAKARTRA